MAGTWRILHDGTLALVDETRKRKNFEHQPESTTPGSLFIFKESRYTKTEYFFSQKMHQSVVNYHSSRIFEI